MQILNLENFNIQNFNIQDFLNSKLFEILPIDKNLQIFLLFVLIIYSLFCIKNIYNFITKLLKNFFNIIKGKINQFVINKMNEELQKNLIKEVVKFNKFVVVCKFNFDEKLKNPDLYETLSTFAKPFFEKFGARIRCEGNTLIMDFFGFNEIVDDVLTVLRNLRKLTQQKYAGLEISGAITLVDDHPSKSYHLVKQISNFNLKNYWIVYHTDFKLNYTLTQTRKYTPVSVGYYMIENDTIELFTFELASDRTL